VLSSIRTVPAWPRTNTGTVRPSKRLPTISASARLGTPISDAASAACWSAVRRRERLFEPTLATMTGSSPPLVSITGPNEAAAVLVGIWA
jgi:hypothetical protein